MSSKGLHWYNNGEIEINAKECPQGFVNGRLRMSEETRERMSQSSWIKNASKEELLSRNKKISNTIQSRTKEEREVFSHKVSEGRKGKGLGHTPWIKGKHVDIWNKGRPMSEEQKQKLRDAYNNLPQEEKDRRKRLIGEAHKGKTPWNKGISYSLDKDVVANMKIKENETKKSNGTYLHSKLEESVYSLLLNYFDDDLVFRQYMSDKYPFSCDFYIASLDLYLEINGNWTHGNMPYLDSDEECKAQLREWQEKSLSSDYYKNAIYTWVDLDVRKKRCVEENKLNYMVIYPSKPLEDNLHYSHNSNIDEDVFYPLLSLIYQATQDC